MIDINSPLVKEFLLESHESLAHIAEQLTQFEKLSASNFDSNLINSIYRKVHTLKGSASFLALSKLETLTHSVETILDYYREQKLSPTGEMVDLLLGSFDLCTEMIQNLETEGVEGEVETEIQITKLQSRLEFELIGENSVVSAVVNREVEIQSQQVEIVQNEVPEVVINKTTSPKESVKAEVKEVVNATEKQAPSKGVQDSTVRVNVKLLDKILNVVGELVLNRNQILQLSKEWDEPQLSKLSHQLNVITTELQADVMTTRMQPVGAVFNKFERIIRDLARSQNKKIKLDLQGQDTELDKTLLELIKDPMTHLIRNACDHGIETPEVRLERGKSAEGNLSIKTYHSGGQITIEITDDGNGINVERVLEKAVSKGIMTEEEAQTCSAHKAHQLIFHPGFSTAAQVTNISGRGVGMDVVKSNIEKIGGQCDVVSKFGFGTTFILRIPLTLAIIPALIVKGGNETFAIPQKNLLELVLLEESQVTKIEKIHDSEFFRLRGELIPILRVNDCLDLCRDNEPHNTLSIVVLQTDNGTYGLIVDEILDTQEIVVKPLSHKIKVGSIYAGATIMGDGAVALILDIQGLFNMTELANGQTHEKKIEPIHEDYHSQIDIDAEELLLFELGDHRKYAIPLCLVHRLEEFSRSDIELSGKQKLIRYRNIAMALFSIDDFINYSSKVVDIKNDEKEFSCIVSTIKGRNFGFLVDEIHDIGKAEAPIDYSTADSEMILGTTYVDGHIVTLIDIHGIIKSQNLMPKSVADKQYKGRVLLAEDSPLYQRVIQETLESADYNVTLVENGLDGFNTLKDDNQFDLVVTDIEMPEMNGFEMTQKVRALGGKYASIPIIAITTRVNEEDLKKGEKVGLTKHLKKLDQKEMLATIEAVLEGIS